MCGVCLGEFFIHRHSNVYKNSHLSLHKIQIHARVFAAIFQWWLVINDSLTVTKTIICYGNTDVSSDVYLFTDIHHGKKERTPRNWRSFLTFVEIESNWRHPWIDKCPPSLLHIYVVSKLQTAMHNFLQFSRLTFWRRRKIFFFFEKRRKTNRPLCFFSAIALIALRDHLHKGDSVCVCASIPKWQWINVYLFRSLIEFHRQTHIQCGLINASFCSLSPLHRYVCLFDVPFLIFFHPFHLLYIFSSISIEHECVQYTVLYAIYAVSYVTVFVSSYGFDMESVG